MWFYNFNDGCYGLLWLIGVNYSNQMTKGACTSQGCTQDEAAQSAEEAAGLGRGPRLGTVSHGKNNRNNNSNYYYYGISNNNNSDNNKNNSDNKYLLLWHQ